jgi:hypothetical protein
MTMALRLRTSIPAALVAGLALLASGCGGSASVALPGPPDDGLRAAAADALTLKGIALDSCSAWRLVSVASTRHEVALAAESFRATELLAARYVSVRTHYDARRKNLPPSEFLPPAQPLIELELGTCWV